LVKSLFLPICGLCFAHPEAQYVNLDNITRDQVEDYAGRKGMSVEEIEKWQGPNLAFGTSAEK